MRSFNIIKIAVYSAEYTMHCAATTLQNTLQVSDIEKEASRRCMGNKLREILWLVHIYNRVLTKVLYINQIHDINICLVYCAEYIGRHA